MSRTFKPHVIICKPDDVPRIVEPIYHPRQCFNCLPATSLECDECKYHRLVDGLLELYRASLTTIDDDGREHIHEA